MVGTAKESAEERVRVGCCGFPGGMRAYFETFDTVEIQQTFYRIVREDTLRRWREMGMERERGRGRGGERSGKEFVFNIKASQLITHPPSSPTYRKSNIRPSSSGFFRPTEDVRRGWEYTVRAAEVLGARYVVIQTPPSFVETEENIQNIEAFFENFENAKPDGASFHVAIEFRKGWDPGTVKRLSEKHGFVICVDPFSENFGTYLEMGARMGYFRLHGSPPGEKMYRYRYTERDLAVLAEKIRAILDSGVSPEGEVFVMFNNIHMRENALEFMEHTGKFFSFRG